MRHVTMPPPPWEGSYVRRNVGEDVLEPAPLHVRKLILNAFTGKVTEADMAYMARALLQLSDEIFELRERISGIEAGLAYSSAAVFKSRRT